MEQQSLSTQYKVGFFIGAGLIVSMVSILLLGGDKAFLTSYSKYRTHFQQVQGLFAGSVVSLSGFVVGNVEEISFSPDNNRLEVHLQIDKKYAERIKEGTRAEIRTQGALGDKYVYLIPSDNPQTLAEGGMIQPGEEGDILDRLTNKDNGVTKILDLVKEMHILVATLNAHGRAANILDNVNGATAQMKKTMGQLDGLIGDLRGQVTEDKNLKTAITSMASIMKKLDQGKGTLGALINDPSLHQNLKSTFGGSSRQQYMKNMLRESIQQSESKR